MTDLDSRIREQEFGNLQGDEHLQQREDQEFVGRYFYRFPTGESGADVFDRATNWWDNTIPVINMQRGIKSASGGTSGHGDRGLAWADDALYTHAPQSLVGQHLSLR
eukprot:3131749-Rhodomonas_salina.1